MNFASNGVTEMDVKQKTLSSLMRQITAILLCLLLVSPLTGCSNTSQIAEIGTSSGSQTAEIGTSSGSQNVETGPSSGSQNVEISTSSGNIGSDESSNQGILYESLFLKYLLFVPINFEKVYINGSMYQEGIDLWTKLQYEQAENYLLTIKNEIETSKAISPYDIAFVKEAIGCLYIDMARYDEAYDYLLDALIDLRDIYGDIAIYTNAVSMALCHYYYAIGDYERCIKEIQALRENNSTDYIQYDKSEYVKLFVSVVLNDIEADINLNQFNIQEAYELYMDNWRLCDESVRAEEDATFSAALEVEVLVAIGDFLNHDEERVFLM